MTIKLKIKTKIIILFVSISLLSLIAFLIITQLSIQSEMELSTASLEQLDEKASTESEKELIRQSHRYLNRLITAESYISNYFFKIIEYQMTVVTDLVADVYRTNLHYRTPKYKMLDSTRENPDLVFYYKLAPQVSLAAVQQEIDLIGSTHTMLRSILKSNKTKGILPRSIDGIFIGTSSGIFYNMTYNAYFNSKYDPRQREWFLNAKENKTIGWTKPYEDDASKTNTITCYQPVLDKSNKVLAVVGIDVTLEAMIDLVEEHFLDVGKILVLDKDGRIINYSSLTPAVITFIGDNQYLNETSNKELVEYYKSSLTSENISSVPKKISYNNQDRLLLFAPIEVPSLHIIVIASLSEIKASVSKTRASIQATSETLIQHSNESFQNAFITILIVFIIIVVLTVFGLIQFSRLLTKPITLLTQKVEVIGNGNLSEKLEVKTGDELEVLAGAFNKMTDDLKSYIQSLKETTAAKERIESELQIAHRIQLSMLPRIFPPFPKRKEFDIFASMKPAKDVGGDYYDFFLINDHKLCLTVGDVSGKGIPGSLFMVISKTLMKTQALTGEALDRVVNKVNNALCEDNDEMMFVTTILFTIDLYTGEVEFVNAGHNPPLLKKSNQSQYEYMKPFHAFVLGARPDYKYKKETMKMEPGDLLFIYSDGVTEAMNSENQQYSPQRLQEKLSSLEDDNVVAIEQAITADIKEFVKDTPASDDVTILAFRLNQTIEE